MHFVPMPGSQNGPEMGARKYQGTDEEDLSSSLDLGTNLLGNLTQVTSSLGASVFSPVKWSASEHWSLTSYRA